MLSTTLPPRDVMVQAMRSGDAGFDGVFLTAVRTTGIFCRPSCPARKPRPQNVDFYPSARAALFAGFRPCLRCRPLEDPGRVPEWLRPLLSAVEERPDSTWTDEDLRAEGLHPARVRRWFKRHHGMTFHAYVRARRLGEALGVLKAGRPVLDTALETGYESLSGFGDAFRKLFGGPPSTTRESTRLLLARITTPLGPMLCGSTDRGIVVLEFCDRRALERQLSIVCRRLNGLAVPGANEHSESMTAELRAYFAGESLGFDTPLEPAGTEFQQTVWRELQAIPAGQTRSYAQIAAAIGSSHASRAAARAVGDNRIAIVVPCHRVIGADGSLTGYGGGLWRKRKLLDHEAACAAGSAGTGRRIDPVNRPQSGTLQSGVAT